MAGRLRDERGALAVVAAMLVTLLFGVAALGVDLGRAMDRKQRVQTQADRAALAGGAELPADSLTPTATDPEVLAVARFLIRNDVYDDSTGTYRFANLSEATLAGKLVSASAADRRTYGHVYYGKLSASGALTPSKNFLTVVGPHRTVQFGIAAALGFSKVAVASQATVGLFDKGSLSTLPFYAYAGCDWGQQIIGHDTSNSTSPTLYTGAGWGESNYNSRPVLATPTTLSPNPSPQHIDTGQPATLTLTGTNLDKAESVGFFLPGSNSVAETVPKSSFASQTTTKIEVPTSIAQAFGADGLTYYVRVQYKNGSGTLYGSDISAQMAYVEVGTATLFCNDQKNSGNFGSLHLWRGDSSDNANNGWLPLNIAKGLDVPKVYLKPYSKAVTSSSCSSSDPASWQSDVQSIDIQCVVTDTGFPQNPASAGFIQGVGAVQGRLRKVDSGCGGLTAGKPPLRSVNVHGTYTINNEVLSCYFTDSSVTVSQVSSAGYAGDPVITPDIYTSPRFFYVPVVNKQPSNGKKSYPIVDFRPAFLTGENGTAFKGHPTSNSYYWDDATTNGLVISNNAVDSFRVVFINAKALPPPPGLGTPVEYAGSGPSQLLLVN